MAGVTFTTSDLARSVGCHPNTVRLYETWGFLPPVPRNPSNNYRVYSPYHKAQFELAFLALKYPYPGGKDVVLDMVHAARDRNLDRARDLALVYLSQIQAERKQAEAAIDYLERWMAGEEIPALSKPLHIGEAAETLNLTRDTLRSWERDGLLEVPRNTHNHYRLYGRAEIGRLRVIRVLVNAGYSHMAILRLMIQLDSGGDVDPRQALDTPRADEEIFHVTDRWLTALDEQEQRCRKILEKIEAMKKLL
jgi:DNA-binding transcriptional MerR regulator